MPPLDARDAPVPAAQDPSAPGGSPADGGRRAPGALAARTRRLVRELAAFGVVGGVAFVVDTGLFNLLLAGPLSHKPLTDKVVSASVATLVSWVGNRWWTYRSARREAVGRELALFVVMNAAALLIAIACLGFSHYALGLHSRLADNVSANVVGIALGTAFRFVAYRYWVFTPSAADAG